MIWPTEYSPCYVSGRGDLGIDSRLRSLFDIEGVIFIRKTKGGMALVEFEGEQYSIPPKNLYFDKNNPP